MMSYQEVPNPTKVDSQCRILSDSTNDSSYPHRAQLRQLLFIHALGYTLPLFGLMLVVIILFFVIFIEIIVNFNPDDFSRQKSRLSYPDSYEYFQPTLTDVGSGFLIFWFIGGSCSIFLMWLGNRPLESLISNSHLSEDLVTFEARKQYIWIFYMNIIQLVLFWVSLIFYIILLTPLDGSPLWFTAVGLSGSSYVGFYYATLISFDNYLRLFHAHALPDSIEMSELSEPISHSDSFIDN